MFQIIIAAKSKSDIDLFSSQCENVVATGRNSREILRHVERNPEAILITDTLLSDCDSVLLLQKLRFVRSCYSIVWAKRAKAFISFCDNYAAGADAAVLYEDEPSRRKTLEISKSSLSRVLLPMFFGSRLQKNEPKSKYDIFFLGTGAYQSLANAMDFWAGTSARLYFQPRYEELTMRFFSDELRDRCGRRNGSCSILPSALSDFPETSDEAKRIVILHGKCSDAEEQWARKQRDAKLYLASDRGYVRWNDESEQAMPVADLWHTFLNE